MDSPKENLGLSSSWVLLYFGVLGLVSVIVGGCIVCLHWRRNLRRERRAQQWVELMRNALFSYSPLLYWINKRRSYGLHAAISVCAPAAFPKSEVHVQIPDSLEDSDTPEGRGYALRDSGVRTEIPVPPPPPLVVQQQPPPRSPPSPIFQERPCAPPLHNLPPMLNPSASYPFLVYPERNIHFYSLPTLDDGLNSFNAKPVASDLESPSPEGGALSNRTMTRKWDLTFTGRSEPISMLC